MTQSLPHPPLAHPPLARPRARGQFPSHRALFAALATVWAFALPAPASADPFMLAGQQAVQMSFSTMQTVIGNNALEAAVPSRPGAARAARPARQAGMAARGPGPVAFASPATGGGAGAAGLVYSQSPDLARRAVQSYVGRLESRNPAAARVAADQFARHDYRAAYRSLTRGTGLSDSDAVDIMAAWVMLGWMIANNSLANPNPANIRGIRAQLAPALAAAPQLADTAVRADLGEEMKLHFVTLHAGWQSAQREGQLARYSDGVADLFRRQGMDLRALSVGPSGLMPR